MTEMRRRDRQLPEEKAWDVLDACQYVTLSMTAEDGAPYAVPVNVVREGNTLYFHGAPEGRKAACLNGVRVCVSCVSHAETAPEESTTRYTSAIAFGTAEPVTDPAEKGRALRLLCGRFKVPAEVMMTELAQYLSKTAVWKITVDDITGKSNIET